MALQRIGRESMTHLLAEMEAWSWDVPYTQRAAAAGRCEPALVAEPAHAVQVLVLLARIPTSRAPSTHRPDAHSPTVRPPRRLSRRVAR